MVMQYLESLITPGGLASGVGTVAGILDQLIPGPAGAGIGAYLPGRSTPVPLRSARAGGTRGTSAGASAQSVGSWSTGTATFHRLANGKIGTVKRNGVWKEWRPYRPVVVPKKWDARAMRRVASALDRQQDTAIKIVKLAGGEATKGRRRK